MNAKEIAGTNIKKYLDAKEVKHSWVMERTGISKKAFYDLLRGEGNVDKHIEKISDLFRIKDPLFFYSHFKEPTPPQEIEDRYSFTKSVAMSFHGEQTRDFEEAMEVLADLIKMLDVLHSINEETGNRNY
ncbi:hypothetical protein REO40_13850 [Clostridium perfringens]|nr:hypothetical protein [Clostridium perfringens]